MKTSSIKRIHAREVFDSRGRPTVEVEVTCCDGAAGRAIVPSGASTGQFEAIELRDGNAQRLDGAGVLKAVNHVRNEIARALVGADADDQQTLDRRCPRLDGTENKSRLGANALLGVSLAAAHAAAISRRITLVEHLADLFSRVRSSASDQSASVERSAKNDARYVLPVPMVNMISGGLHAGGNLDFQDFLILPLGADSFRTAMEWCVGVYQALAKLLNDAGYDGRLVGDEGGFGPALASHQQALEFLMRAMEAARLEPGTHMAIAVDVAATHFRTGSGYRLSREGNRTFTAEEMIDLLARWVDAFPIVSIEDGLADDDWDGWKKLTDRLGSRVQLIGDDLFVTNAHRLERGIDLGVANSVLIKLNQIGTLWETFETLRLALDHGYRPVVSARSGETEDAFIADLAVATGAAQIKIGSVAQSERLAKYNQLLRLEERLGARGVFAGRMPFSQLESPR